MNSTLERQREYARDYRRNRRMRDPVFAQLCRERTAKWKEKNKNAIALYNRQYRLEHREQAKLYAKTYGARYYEKHADAIMERSKQWRLDNSARAKHNDDTKRANNPELYNELRREWVKRNPDKRKAISRKSYKKRKSDDPAYFAAIWLRRRSIRKSVDDGTVTKCALQKMIDNQANCAYCDAPLSESNRHFDHKNPLHRGGRHSIANIVLACETCNLRKGHKPYVQWLAEISGSQ